MEALICQQGSWEVHLGAGGLVTTGTAVGAGVAGGSPRPVTAPCATFWGKPRGTTGTRRGWVRPCASSRRRCGPPFHKAVVTVARELLGFLWAVARATPAPASPPAAGRPLRPLVTDPSRRDGAGQRSRAPAPDGVCQGPRPQHAILDCGNSRRSPGMRSGLRPQPANINLTHRRHRRSRRCAAGRSLPAPLPQGSPAAVALTGPSISVCPLPKEMPYVWHLFGQRTL